jgi:hypothetical protein
VLDASDKQTVYSLRELSEVAKNPPKPLVLWVGAGVSSWLGYPRWRDTADRFHSRFCQYEANYPKAIGRSAISNGRYPDFFQACRDTNRQRFNGLLVEEFSPRQISPVYRRFASALKRLSCCRVLTTNVDESLEREFTDAEVVSRYQVQRAADLLDQQRPFICKLHGSISDVNSTVFTSNDYDVLLNDGSFPSLVGRILGRSTVIFLGYSLRDAYLLSLLARNADVNTLFGDGPHFAVLSGDAPQLPSSVRVIRYVPVPHRDHRSIIQVVEDLSMRGFGRSPPEPDLATTNEGLRSAHLLFHVIPPGKFNTSLTLSISGRSGESRQLIVGPGFTDAELPDSRSTAMHDIVVALLCFDHLHVPLFALGRIHELVESHRFWTLVDEGAISLVHWTHDQGVIFPSATSLACGDLVSFEHFNEDQSKRTVGQIVREQISPLPGKEIEAERVFEKLGETTRIITAESEGKLPQLVRGLLLRRPIRQLLGISGGTPVTSLPRWAVYPVLRLAHVVKIGAACRALGIASAKLDFGTAGLAGPAFASVIAGEWADATASYVLAGSFSADLGAIVSSDKSILDSIIAFRRTRAGSELRTEVLAKLHTGEGREVAAAVNGGLRRTVPSAVLQNARDSLVGLLSCPPVSSAAAPVIWNDRRYAENAIRRWRKRSRSDLERSCREMEIGASDPCPCGSGEKLKFCCREALQGDPIF